VLYHEKRFKRNFLKVFDDFFRKINPFMYSWIWIRIRIRNSDPDPATPRIRIQYGSGSGSGSETLLKTVQACYSSFWFLLVVYIERFISRHIFITLFNWPVTGTVLKYLNLLDLRRGWSIRLWIRFSRDDYKLVWEMTHSSALFTQISPFVKYLSRQIKFWNFT